MIDKLKKMLVWLCFLSVWAHTLAAHSLTGIHAFGDSLSDTGFKDGHGFDRYANGPIWLEYLGERLHLPVVSYAWGGARTDRGNLHDLDWTGFAWQLDRFIASHPTPYQLRHTLFTVLVGWNDLFNPNNQAAHSVANVIEGLERLAALGVQHVLLCSLPDESLAPGVSETVPFPGAKTSIHRGIHEFNDALYQALFADDGFVARHPQMHVYYHDLYQDFEAIYRDEQFPVKHDYVHGHYVFAEGYIWWDDSHPTTAVHKRLAEKIYQGLQSKLVRTDSILTVR